MVALGSQPPGFLQGSSYPASIDRLLRNTAWMLSSLTSDSNTAARGGLLPAPDARSGGAFVATWNITIAPFSAIVENTFASNQGDYLAISTGNLVVALTPSSPTTNRIDIIGVQISDAFYSGAINSADLVVVQGTATAGTPVAPTLPASFEPLWQATVNAGSAAPVFANLRRRTAVAGALCPVFSDQPILPPGHFIGEGRLLPGTATYRPRPVWWDGTIWRGNGVYRLTRPTGAGAVLGWSAAQTMAATTNYVVASVAIPDPGFQFQVEACAHLLLNNLDTGELFSNTGVIVLDSTTQPTAADSRIVSHNWPASNMTANEREAFWLPRDGCTGIQTGGAHTCNLIMRGGSAGGATFGPLNNTNYWAYDVWVAAA